MDNTTKYAVARQRAEDIFANDPARDKWGNARPEVLILMMRAYILGRTDEQKEKNA